MQALCPLDKCPLFFEHVLTLCKVFQAHPVLSPPQPWKQPLLCEGGQSFLSVALISLHS